ncbi:hypothetical protein LMG9964_01048 [Paraburkholderia phenoliruptrix]|uniref:Uncharacterized protein n=3 Tax=Paraburkholderia phenoliruptrix TaxID=252970 RepID=K0DWR9_9BURK|nr:hypothetical protein [Paraburkholderia phenoliruptrix]AFT88483.1 hypothetical protein BUPH_06545 [Paraburkholderia phenoliruptrix BR3459a]MDR6418747.1 hypothetical protein [Paraburkholderia phenoliruptrix]CAB4047416.1 hypothetical protein LMG9964_01048 [Paraburkholderia phenoliruptrix]
MSVRFETRDRTAIAARAGKILRTSAVVMGAAIPFAGCGGGDDSGRAAAFATADEASPHEQVVNPYVVSLDMEFRSKTYSQWAVSFWQWVLGLPVGPLPHPFEDCNHRPISAAQTGNVWFWATPAAVQTICNQAASTIPAGTSIFLLVLDGASLFLPMVDGPNSLDNPPIRTFTADQLKIASAFTNDIRDLFCTVDGVAVGNIAAYRTKTGIFPFSAPSPWIFGHTGGSATAVADGYYLMIQPLPAGLHTIHYGGKFVVPAGVFEAGQSVIAKDVTLIIRVGS